MKDRDQQLSEFIRTRLFNQVSEAMQDAEEIGSDGISVSDYCGLMSDIAARCASSIAGIVANHAKYPREFPDFDDAASADALIAAGFEDISWHNDAMPSFQIDGFRVFVDFADATRSEFADCATLDGERFIVCTTDSDGETVTDAGKFSTVADALAFIRGGA